MEDYILILLLVAPGFLVRAIISDISSKGNSTSEFDKTVTSLLYSLPINIINLTILRYVYNYKTIIEIYNKFSQIQFLLKYALMTVIVSIIFAVLIEFINKYVLIYGINLIRRLLGNEEKSLNYCGWDEFFQFQDEEFKAIKIIKEDGNVMEGFVRNSTYSNDDDKEIILNYGDIIEQYRECFDLIEKEYYNANLNLRIQEYNLDEFLKKRKETDNT